MKNIIVLNEVKELKNLNQVNLQLLIREFDQRI